MLNQTLKHPARKGSDMFEPESLRNPGLVISGYRQIVGTQLGPVRTHNDPTSPGLTFCTNTAGTPIELTATWRLSGMNTPGLAGKEAC